VLSTMRRRAHCFVANRCRGSEVEGEEYFVCEGDKDSGERREDVPEAMTTRADRRWQVIDRMYSIRTSVNTSELEDDRRWLGM
jgi:hypothetical protein